MAELYKNIKMKQLLLVVVTVVLMIACTTQRRVDRNFTYFQKGLDSIQKIEFKEPTIHPKDLLGIQVYSNTLNQEQVSIYNIPNSQGGYLVTDEGAIYFPNIGKTKVAGLTLLQLKDSLEIKLKSAYVKEPNVLIKFLNFRVNMLGEVRGPGTKTFTDQNVTIIDAIATAGDLTDQGRRDSILVIRQENGETKHYYVDLRKTDFMNSPAYQLQQNDIVYVKPNDVKLKTVHRNPNFDRDTQIVFTIFGLITSTITLLYLFKK